MVFLQSPTGSLTIGTLTKDEAIALIHALPNEAWIGFNGEESPDVGPVLSIEVPFDLFDRLCKCGGIMPE